jgi:hypothetical protein
LRRDATGVIVAVLVAFAMTEAFGAGIMGVAQIGRHLHELAFCTATRGPRRCQHSRVALGRAGEIKRRSARGIWPSGMPMNSTACSAATATTSPMRIGQPDVLARENNQPPRNEPRVLARLDHLREPVERGIGIASTHAFDESRDGVVVLVLVLVVEHALFLHALLDGRRVDAHDAYRIRRSGQRGDLEAVKRASRVPFGPR